MAIRGIDAGLRRAAARVASRVGGRRVWAATTAWMVCAVACLAGAGAAGTSVALGAESSSSAGIGGSGALGGLLVTPGSPVAGEQVRAVEEARRANPEARQAREKSRTAFEGLGVGVVAKLAGEVFPALIDEPVGGLPRLPAGQRIIGYPTDRAVQVDLGNGKHSVIESTEPLATETSRGHREAIDLGLSETNGAFHPVRSDVGVEIPKRLAGGVQLPGSGVSLTPIDAQGAALGGTEGALDGSTVLYANTQTDMDTVVKPTAAGFAEDTMLRSVQSPQQLFFRVGAPQGASLVDDSGAIQVVDNGHTIASVLPVSATDAAGANVPVSASVSGNTITLAVDDRAGEYQFPIAVDPTVEDLELTGVSKPTRWKFGPTGATHFTSSGWRGSEALTLQTTGTYKIGEDGYLYYETQGESKITETDFVEVSGKNTGNIETVLQLAHLNGTEEVEEDTERLFPEQGKEYGREPAHEVCDTYKLLKECSFPEEDKDGAPHNLVKIQQSPTAEGSGENIVKLYKAHVHIYQEKGPEEPEFNTASPTLYNGHENVQNVLYKSENKPEDWLGEHNGAYEVKTKDPGIGISNFGLKVGTWSTTKELFNEGKCEGIQCNPEFNQTFTYNKEIPDGEDRAEVYVEDGDAYFGPSAEKSIKVDNTPPSGLALSGLPASGVINEAQYHLQAQAIDGKAPTRSSGIKSLVLGLDGYTLPGKAGSCTPGPCSATGEWAINGEVFGAGKHTLTLVATDYAGNVEKKTYNITVRHAKPLSVGPGSVNPITGALQLGASDVSLSGGRGSLGVSRSYNSRQLTTGEQGPLGPQWNINISGSRSIEQEPTGAVVLVGPDGERTTFESNGKGGYISPKGDENLVLETEKEGEKIKAYLLKDPAAGTTVKYVQPGGAGPWVIASSEGALTKTSGEKETVEWERLEGVTRPKLALAPSPAGVTCSPTVKEPKELSKGCRALSFTYATATTATGEAPSQWKAYKGRLEKVSFTAYNPSIHVMETKPVAEYSYDQQGRLRTEWDPRISPALTTTYGYDSEGHVVAVNPPGQESWLLHYGTTASDTSAGRLLSVTRPPAGTPTQVKEQDEQAAPFNTAVPTLSSTSPVIGTTLSISSNGSWSNGPLAYSDSWEDCYTAESKETCTAIPGAVNSTYTPQARDAGYTLRGQVTAVNADGATVAATAASKALAGVAPAYHLQFGKAGEAGGQFKGPAGDAIDSSGNVWVADSANSRVQEFSASGTFIKAIGWGVSNGKAEPETCTSPCKAGIAGSGAGQFSKPEAIAINLATKNVYVLDSGNSRVEEFNVEGKYTGAFGKYGKEPGQLNAPKGIAIVPSGAVTSSASGEVWVGDTGNGRVEEFSETGEAIGSFGTEGSGNGQFKAPDGIAFSGENAYVVDSGNNRVQELSLSGQYVAQFGSKGTGSGQFETPGGIATEPVSGDLYVADSANNRIEEFNPAGVFVVAYGKNGEGNGEFSNPASLAANPAGDLYVADTGNNRVQELEPRYSTNNPLPEPPALGTSSVTTIDYNVPLSGTGAPHEMTKAELEKWGQTDDPAEPVVGESLATAVFPPDEPMGWPAKDYKRATIAYLDELGRTVNQASPTGGISTSEYNETNEVVRSLGADNRAAALKESNPKEASELLDTKSRYNGETKEEKEQEEKEGSVDPGTKLLETRGPQHVVKLASGGEVKARNHVKYYYDEGAPGGEKFNLVTKSTDGAEYEGKESDVRTTATSYSGQGNLGWLLRKPTSVTTDPEGLNLVSTTLYEPSTGNVIESRGPELGQSLSFLSTFGVEGKENGQFKSPRGVVLAPNGNLYVTDEGNNRVQEISPSGGYLAQWGTSGTGNGQFKGPRGIAVASNGNIYVPDTGNNRVEEFSSSGAYVTKWGSEGAGNGQFKSPESIAVAPNGNVYVGDTGNDRVQEFSSSGAYIAQWGSEGTGNGQFKTLRGIAVAPNGNVYVTDLIADRVQEFTASGGYVTQFGSAGSGNGQFVAPDAVAVAPNGTVYVGGEEGRIQEFTSGGAYLTKWGTSGKENGGLRFTDGISIAANGNTYVSDLYNDRVQTFSYGTRFVFGSQFGSEGTGNGQFKGPRGIAVASNGNIYVPDTGNNRVEEFSSSGAYVTKWGSEGAGNGQFKSPESIAVAPNGNVYVGDTGNDRVQEFSSSGAYIAQWGSEGTGNGQFKTLRGIAVAPNGNVYVTDLTSDRVQEFTASGGYVTQFGSAGSGNGQFVAPDAVAVAPNGTVYVGGEESRIQEFTSAGTYITKWGTSGKEDGGLRFSDGISLDVNGDVYVSDLYNDRVQEFSPSGEYLAKFGLEGSGSGQLKSPRGVAIAPNGGMYVTDGGNSRVLEWTPTTSESAHDAQTIYYTSAANASVPACGGHPEWANLPCQNRPAVQPGGRLPELPAISDTYNVWDEPEVVTEVFASVTRTKKMSYDGAGRISTTEEASSIDTPLPKVTDEYSPETGVMTTQSTTVGETTKSIASVYDTLDQLTEYTDADGSKAQYAYSGPANDNQIEEMSYGGKKGSQMYSYDPTTKLLTKLLDLGPEGGVGAGTFTAGYDVEGRMTSEAYPNGMTAKYVFNPASEATGIEYEKTTHCTEKCVWFGEASVPSIHGEVLSRISTLAKEEYAYDNAGRLVQVNETPAGKGCTSRIYAYDEYSNRTSLTTRKSETETCATSGGTIENHTYDEANRLLDTGVEDETFGNGTKIPSADAGGSEITAGFYVDNQVASQTQNGETTKYSYDPAGRTEKTVSEGTTASTMINHYAGPGEAIAWTEEEGGKKWSRNIVDISGSLAAVQNNGETPTLQLHDLLGNIVATAAVSETETKLLTTYNPTEFGVQVNGAPPTKYSWLGAGGLATEQASGAANPGGSSYVSQLGRPLQTQPVEAPGAYANGSYGGSPYTTEVSAQSITLGNDWAAGAPEREAARQAAAKKEQEEAEERARADQPPGAVPSPGEGGAEGELCEGEKAIWCDEYGEETGQLPNGTDPCFSGGFCIATVCHFEWLESSCEAQVNFNKADSLQIAEKGSQLAAVWVGGLITAAGPEAWPVAAAVTSAILAAGWISTSHIEKNNCIRVSVVLPQFLDGGLSFYRSKKECG